MSHAMPTHPPHPPCLDTQEKGHKEVTYEMIRGLGQKGCDFMADFYDFLAEQGVVPVAGTVTRGVVNDGGAAHRSGESHLRSICNFFGKHNLGNEEPWHSDIFTGGECYADTTFSVSVPVHVVVLGCVSAQLHICSCTHFHLVHTRPPIMLCVCDAGGVAERAAWDGGPRVAGP
jgi:hypothetical protein